MSSSKKDILVLSTGKLFQFLYSFLNIKLLTNLFPVSEVGKYYLIFAVLGFVNMNFTTPVDY